eukprot:m.59246 g.59246  ORF g.59246 m.59246 type:complete len:570 (+) comp13814_c0_seq2:643-2352(+)
MDTGPPRFLSDDEDSSHESVLSPVSLNGQAPRIAANSKAIQPLSDANQPCSKRSKSCPDTSSVISPAAESNDGEGTSCPICYEPWASSGSHRLSSLKCGHLFGLACLERMFQVKQDRCPLCQLPARKADIRPIFAPKSLTTADQTETDALKLQAKQLQAEQKQAKANKEEALQKYQSSQAELSRVRSELKAIQAAYLSIQTEAGPRNVDVARATQAESRVLKSDYKLVTKVTLANSKNRCMTYDESSGHVLVSAHSTHATPFYPTGSHGLSKVDVERPQDAQYIQMHTSAVRDVRVSPNHDGLVLTASTDQTLRLASTATNSAITSLKLSQAAWTCCWHHEQPVYVFAGLTNHKIQVFDIRNTSEHVIELSTPNRDPIVALHHTHLTAGNGKTLSGLVTASLKGVSFWHLPVAMSSEQDCRHQALPLLDGSTTWLATNPSRDSFLASYRPSSGAAAKVTRHVHFQLGVADVGADATCVVQRQLLGGPQQKTLARSALVQAGKGLLACASNEANVSALLWDVSSGQKLQELKRARSQLGYLDFATWAHGSRRMLCGLVDGKMDVYSWEVS